MWPRIEERRAFCKLCNLYFNEKTRAKNVCTMKADKIKRIRYGTYFVCLFMSLLLLMFFEIVFICRRHADPNGFLHLLHTLRVVGVLGNKKSKALLTHSRPKRQKGAMIQAL